MQEANHGAKTKAQGQRPLVSLVTRWHAAASGVEAGIPGSDNKETVMQRRGFLKSLTCLPFLQLRPESVTTRAGTPSDGPVVDGDIYLGARRAGKTAYLWEATRLWARAKPNETQAIYTPDGQYEIKWKPRT